jgi:hypothetical protein
VRKSYVQIGGVLYEKGAEPQEPLAPMVMPDIAEYTSMYDGTRIKSRSQHREHLRDHGLQEIGNETKYLTQRAQQDVAPQQRKELIRRQIDAMRFDEFRTAIKRDVNRVKWNSREG